MSWADPPWLGEGFQKVDCKALHWREQSLCHAHFDGLKLFKLSAFQRSQIQYESNEGSCDKVEALILYENREAAWEGYADAYCDLNSYCQSACGSGWSPARNGCYHEMLLTRIEMLESEIKKGLAIYGCSVQNPGNQKKLETESFTIRLIANCDLGFFECEDVEYIAKKKSDGVLVALNGAPYFESNGIVDLQKGFAFENGSVVHKVSNSGHLSVVDTQAGKVLIDEFGKWE